MRLRLVQETAAGGFQGPGATVRADDCGPRIGQRDAG